MNTVNIGVDINLVSLLKTRLLIQANSGGGKSYAIRKLLEVTNGKVQQIVLDLEGEFFSLREKFDFIVFGNEGDYPIHIKYADRIARTLLEYNASAIIDLYELKHLDRILFVKRFLESMINAPKELWHPCIVVVDEAHLFCSEKGSVESSNAVIDLCTRGRKRGFAAILCTQRLSKLNKDAAAECNNKLIGRTGLDIDMRRASEELGFTSKEDMLALRNLHSGEFYAFGPAISNTVVKTKISPVITTHPEAGVQLVSVPPASDKIKKILLQFKDLPQEAEKELKTIDDLKKEVIQLRSKLTSAQKVQPVVDHKMIIQLTEENKKLHKEVARLQLIENDEKDLAEHLNSTQVDLVNIINDVSAVSNKLIQIKNRKVKWHVSVPKDVWITMHDNRVIPNSGPSTFVQPKNSKESAELRKEIIGTSTLGKCERAILTVLVQRPGKMINKMQLGVLSGYSYSSGGFNNSLGRLRTLDYITSDRDIIEITQAGLTALGEYEKLPIGTALQTYWMGKLGKCEKAILRVLIDTYPESVSKEYIGSVTGYSYKSGGFNNSLGRLRSLELANGRIEIKANEALFLND